MAPWPAVRGGVAVVDVLGRLPVAVFQPWWAAAKVPVGQDRTGLTISPEQFGLDQVLASWTPGDPANAAFSPPGGPHRTAPGSCGPRSPSRWRTWRPPGGAPAHLGLGPAPLPAVPFGHPGGRARVRAPPLRRRPVDGRRRRRWLGLTPGTELAHDRGVDRTWEATAEGVYPGGQSENPASPWYEDQVADWWDGRYRPMPPAGLRRDRSAGPCGHERDGRASRRVGGRRRGAPRELAWLTCAGSANAALTAWAGCRPAAGPGRATGNALSTFRPPHTGSRRPGCSPAWPERWFSPSAALVGWWFLPFLVGLAAGIVACYGRWRLRARCPPSC